MASGRTVNLHGRIQFPAPASLERSGTYNSDAANDGKTLTPAAVFPFVLRHDPSACFGLFGIGVVQDQHIPVVINVLMSE